MMILAARGHTVYSADMVLQEAEAVLILNTQKMAQEAAVARKDSLASAGRRRTEAQVRQD